MRHHMEHRDEHGRHSPAMSKVARKMRGEHAEKRKEEKVFHEFGKHELHSGSKHGPVVKEKKQAVAIAMSEGRKAAHGHKKHHGKHHKMHGKHHEEHHMEHHMKKHHGKHHLGAKKREHEHMEKKKRHEKE